MVVLVASDSFKGSASTFDVIESAERAALRVDGVRIIGVPVADGGEGTAETICRAARGVWHQVVVHDPLDRLCEAGYAIVDGTAVIDMAQASGLTKLKPSERNPLDTNTYGTGELIRAALDHPSVSNIVIGVGGSATNDGGTGLAEALGVQFLDEEGRALPRGGRHLERLQSIDTTQIHPRLKEVSFTIASDVINPLCGVYGASAIYGPQKGADANMVKQLDRALKHYAQVIMRQGGIDLCDLPGSGAGGGTAAGLLAFTSAVIRSGIDTVLDLVHFDEALECANYVITGEGMTDHQTALGKAPVGVARRAKHKKLPVICVSGSLGSGYTDVFNHGVDACFSIVNGPMTLEKAMETAPDLLVDAYENVFRFAQKCGLTTYESGKLNAEG